MVVVVGENEKERQRWNMPSLATSWQKRERITTLTTEPLLALLALRPGERVLDVGCGGGLLAIAAARAVAPSGAVVGFDLSEPLTRLAIGRAADAGVRNVTFAVGDAQSDRIAGGPFDAVQSQFGVMFFADPVAAFAHMRAHMKDGGRLAFACWQPASQNTWFQGSVMAKYAPPPAPTANGGPPPGPFAFGDADYVRTILRSAGFQPSAHKLAAFEVAVPDDTLAEREGLAGLHLDPAREEEAWQALQEHTESMRGSDGQIHIRLAPQFFTARAV